MLERASLRNSGVIGSLSCLPTECSPVRRNQIHVLKKLLGEFTHSAANVDRIGGNSLRLPISYDGNPWTKKCAPLCHCVRHQNRSHNEQRRYPYRLYYTSCLCSPLVHFRYLSTHESHPSQLPLHTKYYSALYQRLCDTVRPAKTHGSGHLYHLLGDVLGI